MVKTSLLSQFQKGEFSSARLVRLDFLPFFSTQFVVATFRSSDCRHGIITTSPFGRNPKNLELSCILHLLCYVVFIGFYTNTGHNPEPLGQAKTVP
jgi:hypothetical protein